MNAEKNILRQKKKNETFTNNIGITLIALVVTIVVLLILAGITINLIFGQNGIIAMARQAAIQQAQAAKEEEVSLAITSLLLKNGYDKSKITINDVVEEVKKNYPKQEAKNSISGSTTGEVENKFPGIIQYDKPSSSIDGTIIVQVNENLEVTSNVTEPGSGPEPETKVEPPTSSYTNKNGIFYNTPDLSGFDKGTTYYVTYDSTGANEQLYGRIDKIEEPGEENVWHDYKNKIWANVVSVNGDEVAYWVWIPRYKYKVNSEGKTIDVKFVDENDKCEEIVEGVKQTIDVSEYELPESFKFGEKNLKGYWMSKYEVQDGSSDAEYIQIISDIEGNEVLTTTKPNGTYTVFLNGKNYREKVNLPIKLSDLEITGKYDIMLIRESDNKPIGNEIGETGTGDYGIEIDISGFDPKTTYYVTYDDDGNNEQILGRIDTIDQPKNWYNYEKKIWANLVSINGDEIAYWTYIPRYEYKIYNNSKYIDVRYIKNTKTTANPGYAIPESFSFGGQELKGYWMSKYEVQDGSSDAEYIQIISDIEGNEVLTTTKPNGTYTVFLNGKNYREKVNLPIKLSDLEITGKYDIMLIRESDNKPIGNEVGEIGTGDYGIEIDISGFDPKTTYYVTYDDDGNNEQISDKPIGEMEAPTGWYNYEKKIWANLVSINGDEIAYWTYIPRYEYKIYNNSKYIDVRYIKSTKTTANPGYAIPESFSFGGQELKGYWMSKYEVQNTP